MQSYFAFFEHYSGLFPSVWFWRLLHWRRPTTKILTQYPPKKTLVVTCRPSSRVESLGHVNEHNPTDGCWESSRKSNFRFDFQRTGQKKMFWSQCLEFRDLRGDINETITKGWWRPMFARKSCKVSYRNCGTASTWDLKNWIVRVAPEAKHGTKFVSLQWIWFNSHFVDTPTWRKIGRKHFC